MGKRLLTEIRKPLTFKLLKCMLMTFSVKVKYCICFRKTYSHFYTVPCTHINKSYFLHFPHLGGQFWRRILQRKAFVWEKWYWVETSGIYQVAGQLNVCLFWNELPLCYHSISITAPSSKTGNQCTSSSIFLRPTSLSAIRMSLKKTVSHFFLLLFWCFCYVYNI